MNNRELSMHVDMATGESFQIGSGGFGTITSLPSKTAETDDRLLDTLKLPSVINFSGTIQFSNLDRQRLLLAFKIGKIRGLQQISAFPKKYRRRLKNLKRRVKILDRKRKRE